MDKAEQTGKHSALLKKQALREDDCELEQLLETVTETLGERVLNFKFMTRPIRRNINVVSPTESHFSPLVRDVMTTTRASS